MHAMVRVPLRLGEFGGLVECAHGICVIHVHSSHQTAFRTCDVRLPGLTRSSQEIPEIAARNASRLAIVVSTRQSLPLLGSVDRSRLK